jgi:hypothetical protein
MTHIGPLSGATHFAFAQPLTIAHTNTLNHFHTCARYCFLNEMNTYECMPPSYFTSNVNSSSSGQLALQAVSLYKSGGKPNGAMIALVVVLGVALVATLFYAVTLHKKVRHICSTQRAVRMQESHFLLVALLFDTVPRVTQHCRHHFFPPPPPITTH